MITINNVQYRNLQEQVEKNKKDILFILEEEGTLSEFGLKLVGQANYEGDLPNPLGYIKAGGQYGDAYAVGRETPYTLFVFTRANGTHPNDYWFNIGKFPLAGPAGAAGAKGDKGEQGLPGERGPEGKVGPMGPQGPAGPRGIQGPQGNNGPVGPQGAQGESFMVVGLLPTTEQLPAPTELIRNEAYLVGADNDYDMYIIIGKPGEQLLWFNAGKVEGVKGDKGDTGPAGVQGPAGATGLQGRTGETGPTGPEGPMGPTGPQGEPGIDGKDGAIGPIGPQGPKGDTGIADAGDLLTLLSGSDTIVVDLAASGKTVEVHVDETFKNTLATKEYVDNLVGQLGSFHVETVSELPESGKENTVYFVGPDSKGNYDEYMYILSKWELLGTTKVDLSGYATIDTTNKISSDVESLNSAVGQHTISIENLQKGKQDKLSQVDLDNIAMINQYGEDITNLKTGKQDKLTAGTNITIEGNTINATGSTPENYDKLLPYKNEITVPGIGTHDVSSSFADIAYGDVYKLQTILIKWGDKQQYRMCLKFEKLFPRDKFSPSSVSFRTWGGCTSEGYAANLKIVQDQDPSGTKIKATLVITEPNRWEYTLEDGTTVVELIPNRKFA